MEQSIRAPHSSKDDRLRGILSHYRHIEVLHPTVDTLCKVEEAQRSFNKMVEHELKVISIRAQDPKDGELNLFQQAFSILMDPARPDDHIAGIHLYVEEILGLRYVDDKTNILVDIVKNRDYILSGMHSLSVFLYPAVATDQKSWV